MRLNGVNSLHRLADRRTTRIFTDGGHDFISELRTLRFTGGGENGNIFTERKLAARAVLSVINSLEAWVAPGDKTDEVKNWQRRRKIYFKNAEYLTDAEIQLDNGFSEYACIHVRNVGSERFTLAAITPILTAGG